MIKLAQNPIDGLYTTSPSRLFAAVHLDDETFNKFKGFKSEVPADMNSLCSDKIWGTFYHVEIPGRKSPLTIMKRYQKVDPTDYNPRTMFFVKHEDVPEAVEEMELQSGTREEIEF